MLFDSTTSWVPPEGLEPLKADFEDPPLTLMFPEGFPFAWAVALLPAQIDTKVTVSIGCGFPETE